MFDGLQGTDKTKSNSLAVIRGSVQRGHLNAIFGSIMAPLNHWNDRSVRRKIQRISHKSNSQSIMETIDETKRVVINIGSQRMEGKQLVAVVVVTIARCRRPLDWLLTKYGQNGFDLECSASYQCGTCGQQALATSRSDCLAHKYRCTVG